MRTLVLGVLSTLYDGVTRVRNYLYDSQILSSTISDLPVISIGNVTAGGNGKTPLAKLIARLFREQHFSPVILSRGYGGSLKGPHLVTVVNTPEEVGDEPLMLAQFGIPVVIARDRVAGALFIEEHQYGNIILLDDGFQHRRLHRGVDLVSINVATPESEQAFLAGKILPEGLFREDRDAALRRADIIILASRSLSVPTSISSELKQVLPQHCDRFLSHLELEGIVHAGTGDPLRATEVVVVSAIANPEGFYHTVRASGYSIVETFAYDDHAQIPLSDLDGIRDRHPGVPIVCTEKDAVKFKAQGDTEYYVVKVRMCVEPQEAFWESLNKRVIRDRKIRKDLKTAS